MAKDKIKRETQPIGFRLESQTVDAIKRDAKEVGLTIQEYFISQIAPSSRLGQLLEREQRRMIEESENMANLKKKALEDALKLKQHLGLSDKDFEQVMMQAVKGLITPDNSK